ncbi:hypothetical protein JCM6882_007675 [Rhodosporidiobolus microsporus]
MLLPQSPKTLLALCALAVLSASSPSQVAASEAGFFDAYVSSRLRSYHAHVAPHSPLLETRSTSHYSNPSRYSNKSSSDSSSSSEGAAPVYHVAPYVPTDAQVKVSRLNNLKASSGNPAFVKKTKARTRSNPNASTGTKNASVKRSLGPQTRGEVKRATTGQEVQRRKLWVRAEPEDAEGDEETEEAVEEGEGAGADWSWMEHPDDDAHEHEDEDEGVLSSVARMEIRMKRSIPLFHTEP